MLRPLLHNACTQQRRHVLSMYFRQMYSGISRGKSAVRPAVLPRYASPQLLLLTTNQACTAPIRGIGHKAPLPQHDPEKGSLVYVGTISGQVKVVKMFSLSTSILGVCLQPVLYTKAATSTLPVALKFVLGGFFNFFIFMTPVLLHFLSKRYMTSLYYNEDTGKFTATNYNFFIREVETTFTREQVNTEDSGMLTTMTVNKKPFFFDPEMFLNHEVYIRMMKYDEPLDISFKPGQYAGRPDGDKEI